MGKQRQFQIEDIFSIISVDASNQENSLLSSDLQVSQINIILINLQIHFLIFDKIGCGKTTLLNFLSGRLLGTNIEVTG